MSATFSVKADMSQWSAALQKLKVRAIPAQVRALNRSASTARTGATRLIAADMQLKAGTVRERIVITEARQSQLSARLDASLKRVPLIDFNAKGPYPSFGKGKGVTARTATRRYPHAFLATMRSGHAGKDSASLGEDNIVKIAEEALLKNLKSEFRFALIESAQGKSL